MKNDQVSICAVFTIATFVCLAIGLGFYLSGCNTNVSNSCMLYVPFGNAILFKEEAIKISERTVCTTTCVGGGCCAWTTIEYYDAKIWYEKESNENDVCYIQVASNVTLAKANYELDKYTIGKHNDDLLKKKYNNECVYASTAYAFWLVGIVFFSLMGFVVLVGMLCGIFIAYANGAFDTCSNILPK